MLTEWVGLIHNIPKYKSPNTEEKTLLWGLVICFFLFNIYHSTIYQNSEFLFVYSDYNNKYMQKIEKYFRLKNDLAAASPGTTVCTHKQNHLSFVRDKHILTTNYLLWNFFSLILHFIHCFPEYRNNFRSRNDHIYMSITHAAHFCIYLTCKWRCVRGSVRRALSFMFVGMYKRNVLGFWHTHSFIYLNWWVCCFLDLTLCHKSLRNPP